MTNHILVERPHPACILPLTHPFRADTLRRKIDVAETFSRHAQINRKPETKEAKQ